MRTLSSSLLAAQKSASRTPYVKAEVVERVAGVTRLSFSRLYTGSEPDFHHAVTMPGDGSLIRARVDSSSYQLYYQRVTGPGPGSDFSTWTGMATVSSASGIALASSGATVLLFYVGTDQKTLYVRESTDYGASFGSPVSILTAASPVGYLAADINGSGVVALFYSVGSTIYVVKRTGGSWGSPSAWTNSVSSLSGMGCTYQGDWNLALTGQDASGNRQVWTCVYGDGYSQSSGTWSALEELTRASSGSGVEFRFPFVGFPDVFRLFFVEKYTGTSAYSRPFGSHALGTADFISNLWREPVPFDLSSSYGLALAWNTSYCWLSMPSGVWRAALSPSSVEVTADVVELTAGTEATSGRVRVVLRNDDGRYNSLTGSYAPIKEGSEVRLSPGYLTTAGEEVSAGPAYWIGGWEYLSRGGRANFVLHAHDGWGLLGDWRARRQYSWASGEKNIFGLLSFVFARAGLEFSALSSSSPIANQYPAFTIHPGESGASAVRRLLAMVPDVLFFRGNYAYLLNPQASDASTYSYGTDHALVEGRYGSRPLSVNRVQVYGDGVMTESFDWDEVSKVYDRLRQMHDLNLDSAAKAQERGQAELRREEIAQSHGEIVMPANCGQELYDVIDITDGRAGLSSAKRRVLGLTLDYSPEEARY
ncbi:MAG: hypothetical protein ACE5IA_05420, partial [Dehalococcoidia bacterium]